MLAQLNHPSEWWRYYGGLADKSEGRVTPIDKPNTRVRKRIELCPPPSFSDARAA